MVHLRSCFISFRLQEGPEAISVNDVRTRTTSALESYNGRLGNKIAGGSNFFKFAALLRQEEAINLREFNLSLNSAGEYKYTPKQRDRQMAIDDGIMLLTQRVYTPEDFLTRVAYSSGTRELCENFDIADIDESDKLPLGAILAAPITSVRARTTRTTRGRNTRKPSTATATVTRSARGRASRAVLTDSRRDSLDEFVVPDSSTPIPTSPVPSTSASASSVSNTSSCSSTTSLCTDVPQSVTDVSSLNNSLSAPIIIQISLPIAPPANPQNVVVDNAMCITCYNCIRQISFNCDHCVYCTECYDRHNKMAMEVYQDKLNSLDPHVTFENEPQLQILCPMCNTPITDSRRVLLL